jgi:hypothetical protein
MVDADQESFLAEPTVREDERLPAARRVIWNGLRSEPSASEGVLKFTIAPNACFTYITSDSQLHQMLLSPPLPTTLCSPSTATATEPSVADPSTMGGDLGSFIEECDGWSSSGAVALGCRLLGRVTAGSGCALVHCELPAG